MMLAKRWTWQDLGGWWLEEKFDGVRAFWDGTAIRTRTWREVAAPAWFTARLPRGVALDGELWLGRGTFQIASELARFARAADPAWQAAQFMLFDWPTPTALPFEERRAKLAHFTNESVRPVVARRCRNNGDAEEALREVLRGGGEGLMLKKPGHVYEFDRSPSWLKLKSADAD